MASVWKGGAFLIGLVALPVFTPLPTDWVALLLLATAALILERFSVILDSEARYSPASAVYVGGAAVSGVGPGALGLILLLETAARKKGRTFEALTLRAPEVMALFTVALSGLLRFDFDLLALLAGPIVLALGFLWQSSVTGKRLKGKERLRWLRARMQLRPLEMTLAAAAVLIGAIGARSPWLLLPLIPLLASTQYAAENIVLLAQDKSTSAVLNALRVAKGESRLVSKALAQAKTDNQLMESFTSYLAGNPDLQQTCGHLLATLEQMIEVDDAVVFLTPNPGTDAPVEPFLYRVQSDHQERLQGVALTRLQEPIVESCWTTKTPRESSSLETDSNLLCENSVSLAFPLGEFGVLYAGRVDPEPFSATEKKRLKWLCDKARLAFDAAFRAHNLKQDQALQKERVRTLEHRVTLLANLINLAEAVASTLELEELAERLGRVLGGSLECDHCLVLFAWDEEAQVRRAWGLEHAPEDLGLLEHVQRTGLSIRLDRFEGSNFRSPSASMRSAVCAPLTAHEKNCGAILLGSNKAAAFSEEALEQLRLMAYQAGMAFSNARLFHQVVLARKQLEDSQQTLTQQSKMSAIGKLAAGVAHELNTPLGVINLSLEEALEHLEEMPALSKRMLEKALKAVHRSRTITDTMLAHSRNPSGQKSEIRLDESVEETLAFLAYEIRNISAKVQVKLEPVRFVGWPQEFHQVVVNLMINALHAVEDIPEQGRRIQVVGRKVDAEAVLEITDGGKGMTSTQIERAFEPFYTTKPVGKGTGLGLWVSLQFVEKLGGVIDIDSKVGEGTRVRVRIPLQG